MRSGSRFGSCSIGLKAGLSLCEILLDWIISLQRMERGADEFPSVVFVTPALYCKTEMILFLWQLCVNVLCEVFLHFMPSACSVYHCLLSDWRYCAVSLLLISCLSNGRGWSPIVVRIGGLLLLHWAAGISTLIVRKTHLKIKIISKVSQIRANLNANESVR